MSSLKIEKLCNQYDAIPVVYCKNCLSLNIRSIPGMEDSNYCDSCGSTDTEECLIDAWENLYYNKYKHKYIEKLNK